ncbi:hypothetical protein ABBQ32_002797 [Trebouxia sp. C0010 RCD-2024]
MDTPCISGSSSGYDSEEERHAEYTADLLRWRSNRLQVQSQQELLQQYRHVQDLLEASKESSTGCNFTPTTPEPGCWQTPDWQHASMSATGQLHGQAPYHSPAWHQHECRWRSMPGAAVFSCLQDIPWPPGHTGVIQAVMLHDQSMMQSGRPAARQLQSSSSSSAWRRAYQQALLRWHPDKMQPRLKKIRSQADQWTAMQQVHKIFDGIQDEWQHISMQQL